MTIRHTKNTTIKHTKRNSGSGGNETVTNTPYIIEFANNKNIADADVTVGNPISYRGHEHIPVGTQQYDPNSV